MDKSKAKAVSKIKDCNNNIEQATRELFDGIMFDDREAIIKSASKIGIETFKVNALIDINFTKELNEVESDKVLDL